MCGCVCNSETDFERVCTLARYWKTRSQGDWNSTDGVAVVMVYGNMFGELIELYEERKDIEKSEGDENDGDGEHE